MPKRPTSRARNAENELLILLGNSADESKTPMPTVRELGERFGLSYSTVSRLLQRFVKEGRVWQHPNGRFYPASAGPQAAVGLPIVVVGRQIQHWSGLYQEILEGVSEVCTARGCPLIFLSSNKLVRHRSPELPPTFATLEIQREELQRIAAAMPRLCAGILFDHQWDESLILATSFPSAPRLLLARESADPALRSNAPDFFAGAQSIVQQLTESGCHSLFLAIPFTGDQAVDATGEALKKAAKGILPVESIDCSTPANRKKAVDKLALFNTRSALVCTEDNVTQLLWQEMGDAGLQNSKLITLMAMQGTGVIDLPITRLRYDYRELGRNAVEATIKRRDNDFVLQPTLLASGRNLQTTKNNPTAIKADDRLHLARLT